MFFFVFSFSLNFFLFFYSRPKINSPPQIAASLFADVVVVVFLCRGGPRQQPPHVFTNQSKELNPKLETPAHERRIELRQCYDCPAAAMYFPSAYEVKNRIRHVLTRFVASCFSVSPHLVLPLLGNRKGSNAGMAHHRWRPNLTFLGGSSSASYYPITVSRRSAPWQKP